MVEELKLAVKVDDDVIEQSLLKQFNNAEKLADKVVFTFKNVNLDNKEIEKQFKDMQKLAGKNPIELPIDTDKSLKMLQALGDEFTRIISIAKGLDGIKTDFGTKNKTEAYNQLKQMADVFKKFYGNEEAMHSKAGTDAAYAYYKAYEEALKKGVAQSKLERVTVDADPEGYFNANRLSSDRIKDFENFKKYGGELTELSTEISSLESRLLKFGEAFSKVSGNLGEANITPDILKNIEEYVRYLEIAESRAKDADLMGFSKDDINDMNNLANMYLGFAMEDAIQENEKYKSSLKEVREEKEKTDEVIKHSSTSTVDDSKFDELKADVTEIREELNGVKEKISAIDSEGFEHVKADVEKTVESVKELNSELTEVKSKLDNTSASPVETNILSPIKDTFKGEKIQEATTSARELDRTLEGVEIPKENFDDIIAKFNIIEEKAKNIAKITQSSVWNQAKNNYDISYTVKYKDGSSEILGENSNPQKLRSQNVLYDVKQAERLQKDFNKAYEEATKINNALTETKGKLDGLSKHPELSSQFSEVENTIKSLNTQLTQGEISVSEYNKAVKETTSNYSKLVSIQQKRDTETYNANAKQARDEAKALEQAAKQAQKLAEEKRKARQADKQSTQSSVDKALKDQLDAWEAIQKIRLQIAQTDSKDTDKLHNLNEQKKSLQKQYNEAGKVLKANKDLYNQTEQQLKLDHERLETNEKINKLKLTNDVGSVLSKGDSDLKKFEARKNQSEEYRATVEKLKQSIEELRVLENSRVSSKLLSAEEVENINKAIASVKEYTEMIKNMPAVEKGSDEGSRTKLANRIHEYMDKNTRMTREFREEFENLIRVLRSGDDSVNIKDIARQFEDVKFRVKEAKLEGISFFDIFKNKAIYGFAARLAQYYLSFYDFIRYARYAVNALVELDSALLDLKKTTTMSESQLEDFYYASNDVAKQMGVTTTEIIEQASAWSRFRNRPPIW